MTRKELAELLESFGQKLVLSVYLARESQDPGKGEAWRRRLAAALGEVRTDLGSRASDELPAFEGAAEHVMSALEVHGRVLPHQGWCVLATEEGLVHQEALPFPPPEMVRWRQGVYAAPYVRAFKSARPVILALMDRSHAHVFRFQDDILSSPLVLSAEEAERDALDVGIGKRASSTSGVRGMTGADFVQRTRTEEARRLRGQVTQAVLEMCGDVGLAVLGGTHETATAARNELEEKLPGRVLEIPELSFDTARDGLVAHLKAAASRLTADHQSALLEECGDPRRGSRGWNETYRALAAGAVDTLMVARGMIETTPDDAERLVRLALTQGADVEEVGGEVGKRLLSEASGVAARLRFVPASLHG
jgi:hypothetical protein